MGFQDRLRQLHRTSGWFIGTEDGSEETKHLPLSPVEVVSYPISVLLTQGRRKLPSQLLVSQGWIVVLEMVGEAKKLHPC